MAKGSGKKPDFKKNATDKPAPEHVDQDELSAVDKGKDFVKAGERA